MKLSLLFPLLVLACHPSAPAAPLDDVASPDDGQKVTGDGLGTPIGEACAELRAIGCREGFPDDKAKNADGSARTCYQVLVHSSTALGVVVPSDCIRTSVLPEVVRRCGDANSIRVSCAVLVDAGAK